MCKPKLNRLNAPTHYKTGNGDCLDYLFDIGVGIDFCKGNIIKYVARAGKKDNNTEIQDLRKVQDYVSRLIQYLEYKEIRENGECSN